MRYSSYTKHQTFCRTSEGLFEKEVFRRSKDDPGDKAYFSRVFKVFSIKASNWQKCYIYLGFGGTRNLERWPKITSYSPGNRENWLWWNKWSQVWFFRIFQVFFNIKTTLFFFSLCIYKTYSFLEYWKRARFWFPIFWKEILLYRSFKISVKQSNRFIQGILKTILNFFKLIFIIYFQLRKQLKKR